MYHHIFIKNIVSTCVLFFIKIWLFIYKHKNCKNCRRHSTKVVQLICNHQVISSSLIVGWYNLYILFFLEPNIFYFFVVLAYSIFLLYWLWFLLIKWIVDSVECSINRLLLPLPLWARHIQPPNLKKLFHLNNLTILRNK